MRFYFTQDRNSYTATVVGLQKDVSVAKSLYDSLLKTIKASSKARLNKTTGPEARNYCVGFVDAILLKLEEQKQQESAGSFPIGLSSGSKAHRP